ncbi:helix-turn-helix transcriptional regulator [Thermophilibacter sp.]
MGLRVNAIEDVFPLADFLADVLGDSVEVVVHDITDLESSIVHIRNGELSGRRVGDGTTDAALRLIRGGRASREEYVASYEGAALGGTHFRCATYFIKNYSDELIGLLCVNVCTTGLDEAIQTLTRLRWGGTERQVEVSAPRPETPAQEMLHGDPDETIRRVTRSVLAGYPVGPERLSRDEKLRVLEELDAQGVFLMKGAVSIVAAELATSTPTLYRYLQTIREQ